MSKTNTLTEDEKIMNEPTITLEWIKENDAYDEFISLWSERFGDRATVTDTVKWLHKIRKEPWEAWFLSRTPEVTKAALAAGADVHVAGDDALVRSVWKRDAEIVKILCDAGADVNARGGAALQGTVLWGFPEITKILCDFGADVNARGGVALWEAVLWGHLGVVKELQAAGADFGVLDDFVLEWAEKNSYTELIDYIRGKI